MNVILLIVIIVCLAMQTLTKRIYNDKVAVDGKYFFSTMIALAAMLFFVITSKGLSFHIEVLPYSALFALSYAATTVFAFMAISCGPLSVTALLLSYALLIPTLYGLIFLHEPVDLGLCAGIVFLAISLYLISIKNEKSQITWKWVICILLAVLGNGLSMVIQKIQQNTFQGGYKNEFMIVALLLVTVFLGALALLKERDKLKGCLKNGIIYGGTCGIANGIVNLLVMILSSRMPVSLLFPTVSAGEIVLTYILSILIFKEYLSKKQITGFCFGVVAVILLNI